MARAVFFFLIIYKYYYFTANGNCFTYSRTEPLRFQVAG